MAHGQQVPAKHHHVAEHAKIGGATWESPKDCEVLLTVKGTFRIIQFWEINSQKAKYLGNLQFDNNCQEASPNGASQFEFSFCAKLSVSALN
jgi:hypothetical protein